MDGRDRHRAARGAGHVGMLHVPLGRPRPPRARGHAGLRAGGSAARRSGRGRRGAARRRHRHAGRPPQRSGPDAGLLDRGRHARAAAHRRLVRDRRPRVAPARWRLRLPWPPRRPDHRGRLPRRPAGDRGGVPRRAGGGGLRRPRHQPETRHHDHRAGPFRQTPPTPRSRNWRRRGWRATSNRGPSCISMPCPDPRTESSTGARSPGLVRKALP
jgi:hypothetical protein